MICECIMIHSARAGDNYKCQMCGTALENGRWKLTEWLKRLERHESAGVE